MQLCLVDMRFPRGPPAVTYDGYFNGYVSTMVSGGVSAIFVATRCLNLLRFNLRTWQSIRAKQYYYPERLTNYTAESNAVTSTLASLCSLTGTYIPPKRQKNCLIPKWHKNRSNQPFLASQSSRMVSFM